MNVYKENGFNNRADYLNSIAEEYGVDANAVYQVAQLLGSSEDFDGLISMVQDMSYGY
jgi:hypothetical protein